ncbi:MAG: nucleotidyltransferase substrate binding protein [Methanosarcinaceae archaeon]
MNKAINSLKRAVNRSQMTPYDEELRDAVIQRFEYTYELCWKMLKRQLEVESPNPSAVDALSFRDLMREGAEKGMIRYVEDWFIFREQRNITSHTYDENKAVSVYNTALDFLPHARDLLNELEKRQHD